MNFKDINNKEALKTEISSLLSEYESMLLQWTDSPAASNYKKAALLYYWMRDYKNMLEYETKFDPKKLRKYSRGDVVSINLGFNPGGEEGGLHYAIVMEDNPRSSSTVTVVPLRSKKPKDKEGPHWTELYIGDEIFVQLRTKINTLQKEYDKNMSSVVQEISNLEHQLEGSSQIIENTKKFLTAQAPTHDQKMISDAIASLTIKGISELREDMNRQLADANIRKDGFQSDERRLKQCKTQFLHMKSGSIAMTGKITTLSKLRISNPMHNGDALDGIRISKKTMDKICQKVAQLYCNIKSTEC